MRRALSGFVIAALLVSAPAAAQVSQRSVGVAANFQGYSFAKELGVTAANLLMVPVAYEMPITRSLSFDVYSAFARGAVEISDTVYTMTGFVDTRMRLNWTATPWAIVTVGLNLPTGDAQHSGEEAVVANVLATEVLGFREASWGLGFGATTGLATAYQLRGLGVGLGASYRMASEFEPRADTSLTYTPGNETRLRLALDANVGTSKLTGGLTYQNYTKDKLDNKDLFQPGARWRGDVAFSFRTGTSASWTLFAADIWRQHGDVTIELTDGSGNVTNDSTFSTGKQNVLVAGLTGAVRISSGLSLRPTADLRYLTREEVGGEGWIAGVGTDFPMRWKSFDVIPSAKFMLGQLEGATEETHRTIGGEVGLNLRWGR